MNKYWSKEEFEEVVKSAKTIREVLRYFGLPSNQGHYNRMFHKSVQEFGTDITHIMESVKRREFTKKIPIEELFVANSHHEPKWLKKRLIQEGLMQDKCSKCGQLPIWFEQILVLQLDHINGDNADNRIENLRLLCPNCHSQTETFGGKNRKKNHTNNHVCKICGGHKKNTKSKICERCRNISQKENTKIEWPLVEEVINMTQELGFTATGKKLGVSDNAVRKFLSRNK